MIVRSRSPYRLSPRRRRGLGDCMSPDSSGLCSDGSVYTGDMALSSLPLSLQPISASLPAPASPSSSGSLTNLAASILPASFTTLQEAIAQPGQVVKTPTALITGAGGASSGLNIGTLGSSGLSVSSLGGLTGLLIPALLIGGAILLFSKK